VAAARIDQLVKEEYFVLTMWSIAPALSGLSIGVRLRYLS
jgi:hypothetical protein